MESHGHTVLVEKNAGVGSGFDDKTYAAAGAEIVKTPKEIYDRAEMVMHVKEPQPVEYPLIRKDQIVFTYLHLAADETLTRAMIKTQSIDIATKRSRKRDGSLPLLIPMSEVAGRMSIQEGAKYLEMEYGGRGVLLGASPAWNRRKCWSSARNGRYTSARMACGLGARVYVIDSCSRGSVISMTPCRRTVHTDVFTAAIRRLIREADLVVGSVLIPGQDSQACHPRHVKTMKKGSVMVDVAIDQGAASKPPMPRPTRTRSIRLTG